MQAARRALHRAAERWVFVPRPAYDVSGCRVGRRCNSSSGSPEIAPPSPRRRVTVLDSGVVDPWEPLKESTAWMFSPQWFRDRKASSVRTLKTSYALSKVQAADKVFSLVDIKHLAWCMHVRINRAFAAQDFSTLRQLCAPSTFPILQQAAQMRTRDERHVWWVVPDPTQSATEREPQASEQSLFARGSEEIPDPDSNTLLQARTFRLLRQGAKEAYAAQLTLEFRYRRCIAVYKKVKAGQADGSEQKGAKVEEKLVAGNDREPQEVREICVFQKELSDPDSYWRYLAKINVA